MKRDTYRRALTPIAVILTMVVLAASTGCLWAPDLAMVRKDLQRQLPGVTFDKEIELTLGPISLAFARLFAGVIPDARAAGGYLGDVSRIELAVYKTQDMPPASSVAMPERLRKMTEGDGWEMAVRIRDDDELSWVFYRLDEDTIKELYVVVMDRDELVLVKAEGNLERLVARALSDSGALKGLPRSAESI